MHSGLQKDSNQTLGDLVDSYRPSFIRSTPDIRYMGISAAAARKIKLVDLFGVGSAARAADGNLNSTTAYSDLLDQLAAAAEEMAHGSPGEDSGTHESGTAATTA